MAINQDSASKHVTLEGLAQFYEQLCSIFMTAVQGSQAYEPLGGKTSGTFKTGGLQLFYGDNSLTFSLVEATDGAYPTLVLAYGNGQGVELPIDGSTVMTYNAVMQEIQSAISSVNTITDDLDTRLTASEAGISGKASVASINVGPFNGMFKNLAIDNQFVPMVLACSMSTDMSSSAVDAISLYDVVYVPSSFINTAGVANKSFGLYIVIKKFINAFSVLSSEYAQYIGPLTRHHLYFDRSRDQLCVVGTSGGETVLQPISFATQTVVVDGEDVGVASLSDIASIFGLSTPSSIDPATNDDSNDNDDSGQEEE